MPLLVPCPCRPHPPFLLGLISPLAPAPGLTAVLCEVLSAYHEGAATLNSEFSESLRQSIGPVPNLASSLKSRESGLVSFSVLLCYQEIVHVTDQARMVLCCCEGASSFHSFIFCMMLSLQEDSSSSRHFSCRFSPPPSLRLHPVLCTASRFLSSSR